jgi:hypothetical protein
VIPEAAFLFSMAGLNASFAGLAGLVMAFRRGEDIRPVDAFRLRQMVEFSFTNIVIAVSLIPVTALVGDESLAARWVGGAVIVIAIVTNVLLTRRARRARLPFSGWWAASALGMGVALVAVGIVVAATGSIGWLEVLLVLLLVRPMLPFLLVLDSWEPNRGA